MAYTIKVVTIRTDNSKEGMAKIDLLWKDVMEGKLPILFDSEHQFQQGISPVSRYSNYESNEEGAYDLSILGVTADFFSEMEKCVATGQYIKYDEAGDNLVACTKKAWERVWNEQKECLIQRAFTVDYESTVPAEYTKDGKCHCYLYIAVEE